MAEKRKDHRGRVLRAGESQRKDKTYMYRYTTPLGTRECVYAATLDELRAKEEEVQDQLRRGIIPTRSKIKVKELAARSIEHRRLKANTIHIYKLELKKIQNEPFMHLHIKDVRISTAKAFMIHLEESGNGEATIELIFAILRVAFREAYEDDLIDKNPFDFTLSKVIKIEDNKREALTQRQQDSLLAYVSTHKRHSKFLDEISILLGTGLRIGEFCALTEEDVDFTKKRIHVTKQYQILATGKHHITAPKTVNSIRYIPMRTEVEEALRRVLSSRPQASYSPMEGATGAFLFLRPDGSIRNPRDYQRLCREIQKGYNQEHAEPIKLTPHVLRHTFCTNEERRGTNIKVLQYVMGHAKSHTTLDVYSHVHYADVATSFLGE